MLGEQIRERVRDLLVSGKLVAGERIPSTRELAESWGTDVRTVHTALTALVKEGLLERHHGKGTFVRERVEKLTEVGVYYPEDVWAKGGSQFLQALHAALKEELSKIGVETDVWVDPRPIEAEVEPWAPFVTAAQRREFQAVIVPVTGLPQLDWLHKLQLPAAYLSSLPMPNGVTLDTAQFFTLALRELKRQGCKSVGVVPSFDPRHTNPDGSPHESVSAMNAFVDSAADLGIALRNEWLCTPDHSIETQAEAKRFGYEATTALWQRGERPDGLIVTDDVAAAGVITALVEQGVKAPGDLKLVLYKNSAIDIFCPLPATFVEINTSAIATALVGQVQKQFRGESVQPITVGFQVADGRPPGGVS